MQSIFDSFNLCYGDTPITTDSAANVVAAFKITNETRLPCMAHRCNTVLETAWDETKRKYTSFEIFCNSVRDLRKFINQTSGIQDKLPATIKSNSGTRPWRSYFTVHDSINTFFETLTEILRARNEQNRLFYIDTLLLLDIVDFMRNFSLIFDHLEFSSCPTLQNVVPSYYKMVSYCEVTSNTQQKEILNTLKIETLKSLNDKYWTSITTLHWIASYLEPTFKCLTFIQDKKERDKRLNEIRKGLHVLAHDLMTNNDNNEEIVVTSVGYASSSSPPPKKCKNDPFADIRQHVSDKPHLPTTTLQVLTRELDRQIQLYSNMDLNDFLEYDNNPLYFWKHEQYRLPLLAKIARSIFVIQGKYLLYFECS